MNTNAAPFQTSTRRGLALMSQKMLTVLHYLRQSKVDGWPFVIVEGVHKLTLNALVNRDWAFASKGPDGIRYGITERGERALKVYEKPLRRYDNICPSCGERPKHVTASGRKDGYCLECASESKRKAYRLKRPHRKEGRLCSRCAKRPVHVNPSGYVLTYCLHCKNVLNRRRKKRDRKRDVQLAQQGIVQLCTRPSCTRPRHVQPSGVLDWCREHYREWHNEYRHKKKAGRIPGKPGRPRKNVESLQ